MKYRVIVFIILCGLVCSACDRKVSKSINPSSSAGSSLVNSTYPADGAINVMGLQEARIYFSDNTDLTTIGSSDFSISENPPYVIRKFGQVVYLDFYAGLHYKTNYTITVGPFIYDKEGNRMLRAHSWAFGTGPGPNIVSHNPQDGAINIPIDASIEVIFNWDMDSSTINSSSFMVDDTVSGLITYSDKTARFVPVNLLSHGHQYRVTLLRLIKDISGNRLQNNFEWSFSTVGHIDSLPPSITAFQPTAGATEVPLNSTILVTFDEPIDTATVNESTFYLEDSESGSLLTGSITFGGTSMRFTPDKVLKSNHTYIATVAGGITDMLGIPRQSEFSWSFSTEEVIMPPLMPLAVGNQWVYEYSYYNTDGLTHRYDLTITVVSELVINSEIWYVDQHGNRYINRVDGLYGINDPQNGIPRLISYIPNIPYNTIVTLPITVPAGQFGALYYETYEVYFYDYGTIHRHIVPEVGLVSYDCYFSYPFLGDRATYRLLSYDLIEN